jgi:hypothetical protein
MSEFNIDRGADLGFARAPRGRAQQTVNNTDSEFQIAIHLPIQQGLPALSWDCDPLSGSVVAQTRSATRCSAATSAAVTLWNETHKVLAWVEPPTSVFRRSR